MFKSTQPAVKKLGTDLISDFNDLYEGFFRPLRMRGGEIGVNQPLLDVTEEDNRFLVTVEMPGIKKEDIEVSMEKDILTIKGEKSDETIEENEGRIIRQERSYGKYLRQFQLGSEVDDSKTTATYKDGVLKLEIPKKESSERKKVKVDIH